MAPSTTVESAGRSTPVTVPVTTDAPAVVADPSAAAHQTSREPAELTDTVPVLMYHRVQPEAERPDSVPYPDLYLEPDLFREHVSALYAEGWRTVTARQVAEAFAAGTGVPEKSFVITVDDGYRDGYDHILPVLKEFEAVGTFYVVPERLGQGQAFEPTQLVELAAAGNEIGNHTWGHDDLAAVGQQGARESIKKASDRIEKIVGARPVTLAYPAGSYDSGAIEAATAEGIMLAFTTQYGALDASSDLLAAPRIRIHGDQSAVSVLDAVKEYTGDD